MYTDRPQLFLQINVGFSLCEFVLRLALDFVDRLKTENPSPSQSLVCGAMLWVLFKIFGIVEKARENKQLKKKMDPDVEDVNNRLDGYGDDIMSQLSYYYCMYIAQNPIVAMYSLGCWV